MKHTKKNLTKLPRCREGDVFEWCNFAQPTPHTPVGAGVKGLVFRKCNLVNCDVPDDAVLDGCCHVQVDPPPPLTDAQKAWNAETAKIGTDVRESFEAGIADAIDVAIRKRRIGRELREAVR